MIVNFQSINPQIKAYEQDLMIARQQGTGSSDANLIDLRNKLLSQNSFALEQLTRRKMLGSSDSGSSKNNPQLKSGSGTSGSDSNSLEKPPIFIFNLLNNQMRESFNGPLLAIKQDQQKITNLPPPVRP